MKIYLMILLLLLTSCSSRKVLVNKTETKKDSTAYVETTTKTVNNIDKVDSTSINTDAIIEETTITPFDTTKTIYVNNVPYKNVVLSFKKSKINSLYKNKNKESDIMIKDSIGTKVIRDLEETNNNSRNVDAEKTGLPPFWMILLLIIIILWLSRR